MQHLWFNIPLCKKLSRSSQRRGGICRKHDYGYEDGLNYHRLTENAYEHVKGQPQDDYGITHEEEEYEVY